jgi:hypothetical protein
MENRGPPSRLAAGALQLDALWTLLLIVGAYGAALGWRPGAYLLLTAVFGLLAGHLLAGLIEYRRIMRRPWPQVPPLTDDDDDW